MINQITFTHLSKSYDSCLFENIQFHLKQGEIMGLFGKNGCGKSTLLKCVFGIEKADSIQIEFNNSPLSPRQIIPKQLIGYLPQFNFLPPLLLVRQLIETTISNPEHKEQLYYAPGIGELLSQTVGELSSGQLRYFSVLLLSFLPHPFLLLDEPFAMIEPKYSALISSFLQDLKQEKGILITDHYYHEVWQISDRKFLLQDAKLHQLHQLNDLRKYGYLSKNNFYL